MAKFTFTETRIRGLIIVEPRVFGDSRGYFLESYNRAEFEAAGLDMTFVQDNESRSRRGVLRGLHFQTQHQQGKLVRVVDGEVLDVAVDLRRGSPTFGAWESVLLTGENKRQFYVPEGFAHGFAVLSETATFCYKCTDFYAPEYEAGILWSDAELGIDWRLPPGDVILSDKDRQGMSFAAFHERIGSL